MRLILPVLVIVTGCGLVPEAVRGPVGPSSAVERAEAAGQPSRPQARPAPGAGGGSAAPVVPAARAVPVGALGRSVASLGTAAEPGLWLKTPLVATRRSGQVQLVSSGMRVAVTLIPIDGPPTAGSRLSLAAMQALGAPLSDLVEVDVVAN